MDMYTGTLETGLPYPSRSEYRSAKFCTSSERANSGVLSHEMNRNVCGQEDESLDGPFPGVLDDRPWHHEPYGYRRRCWDRLFYVREWTSLRVRV